MRKNLHIRRKVSNDILMMMVFLSTFSVTIMILFCPFKQSVTPILNNGDNEDNDNIPLTTYMTPSLNIHPPFPPQTAYDPMYQRTINSKGQFQVGELRCILLLLPWAQFGTLQPHKSNILCGNAAAQVITL